MLSAEWLYGLDLTRFVRENICTTTYIEKKYIQCFNYVQGWFLKFFYPLEMKLPNFIISDIKIYFNTYFVDSFQGNGKQEGRCQFLIGA